MNKSMNYTGNYKSTTKEMVSERYPQIHTVLKEKSLTKRAPGARERKKFLLPPTDLCKPTKLWRWGAVSVY